MRRLFCTLALLLLAGAGIAAPDLSSPEKTIRSFVAALNRGDIETASACVAGAKRNPPLEAGFGQQLKWGAVTFMVTNLRVQTAGNAATATMVANVRRAGSNGGASRPDRVSLRRAGSAWKIVPADPRASRQERSGVVLGIATFLANPEASTAGGRAMGLEAYCLSSIKQLAIGAMMFVQDHDQTFALPAATYKTSLMPYIRNEAVFHCRGDKSGGVSYAFNPDLAGVPFRKIPRPAETVLLYEGANRQLAFRHDGKAAVAFADGHARLITREQVRTLRWKP